MSKLSKFAKEVMGYNLTEYQTKLLEALGEGFAEGKQVVHTEFKGRAAGKTVAMQILGKYIQDGLSNKEPERNWYIVDKDYPQEGGMPILGGFSTASDAGVAREYIERKSQTDHTYWLEERKK